MAFSFSGTFDNFISAGAIGGSAAYAAALDHGRWESETIGTVTLGGLTAGSTYQVQLWITDTRLGLTGLVRTVKGGEATATSTTSGGPNIVTGTFIADAATQTITIAGVSGAYGTQLNLLQLRDLTPVVANSNDSGPGSLRAAITAAAGTAGPDTITFAPALSGGTISVHGSQNVSAIEINDAGGVTRPPAARPARQLRRPHADDGPAARQPRPQRRHWQHRHRRPARLSDRRHARHRRV